MPQRVGPWSIWISTIAILVLDAVQGLSGDWAAFFRGAGGSKLSHTFMEVVNKLTAYHMKMGFAIAAISILIMIFVFLSKTSIYVRVFTILGFAITASAATGGFFYVTSKFQDRLSLGQMGDSFIGAFAAYFLMLFFLNKTPRFPWSREKAG